MADKDKQVTGWCPMSSDELCCGAKCAWWIKTEGSKTPEGKCVVVSALVNIDRRLRDIAGKPWQRQRRERTGQ